LVLDPQLSPLPKGSTWSVLVESTGSLCDEHWVLSFAAIFHCFAYAAAKPFATPVIPVTSGSNASLASSATGKAICSFRRSHSKHGSPGP
jgi:hypothetical protein